MRQLCRNKTLTSVGLFFVFVSLLSPTAAQKKDKNTKRMEEAANTSKDAAEVIDKLIGVSNQAIPKEIFDKAEAIGVFTIKQQGNLIVGIAAGKGVVCRRVSDGWGNAVFFEIASGSLGPQIGYKSSNLVLLFMNGKAVSWLSESSLVLRGEKKASPGPASNLIDPAANIYNYVFSSGKFIGLEYKKIILMPDNNLNKAVYGAKAQDILKGEKITALPNTPEGIKKIEESLTRLSSPK